jgi:peptidoglycan/LPS O-acetylase OafA/YrhL
MTDKPNRLGRVAALDGLRGIAIVLVLLHHTVAFVPSTFLGVQGFFVLSGFLITTLLLEEHAKSGHISLRAFYRRRALRLFPALWIAMVGYLILAAATGSPSLGDALRGVGIGLIYMTNIVESLSPTLVPVSIGHLWSLAMEEQFYLLWPPLLIVALRAKMPAKRLMVTLAILAVIVAINRSVLTLLGFGWRRVYYAPDTTFDAVLIGCAAAVAFYAGLIRRSDRLRAAGRIACFSVLPVMVCLPDDLTYTGGMAIFEIGFAVTLLSVVAGADNDLAGRLANRQLRALGRISYGVYLWDWILTRELRVSPLAAAAAAIVVAGISYRLVELPFLRKKRGALAIASHEPIDANGTNDLIPTFGTPGAL